AILDRTPEESRRAAAVLSAEELARSTRFRYDQDRDRFIVGRATLRRLLAGYLGGHPAAIDIEPGRFDKPGLAGRFAASRLRFNLSHSAGLAAFAFTV